MIGVIIQARTNSQRFPGKVLADLKGSPVVQHVIDRCQQWCEKVVLAVPYSDMGVFRDFGVPVHYGPEHDVLERYVGAAEAYKIDKIMRITADCPLIQPELMEEVYQAVPSRLLLCRDRPSIRGLSKGLWLRVLSAAGIVLCP